MHYLALFASLIFLPGGEFYFGSDNIDKQFPNAGAGLKSMLKAEEPRRKEKVAPFFIDSHEVTNEEYLRFVKLHPEYTPKTWSGEPEAPVTYVTWFGARAYCASLAKRLPTEIEWEYSARGGKDSEYPWGTNPPTPELANYSASKINAPVKVGSYPPNGYGLYDMVGNVWEFTNDNWSDRHDAPPVTGPAARKVIRGGSFGAATEQLRVTFRDSHKPDDPVPHVGFRCARDGR